MRRQFPVIFLLFLLIPNFALAARRILRVPKQYNTIQAAINAANPGDTIVVDQGTYTGHGNRDLDFGGDAVSLRSAGVNWDLEKGDVTEEQWQQHLALMETIKSNTIIDCQGGPDAGTGTNTMHRAFNFHSGEDENSEVIGFAIINGYARGPRGLDGDERPEWPHCNDDLIDDTDPFSPPRACLGLNATGPGYGGAILLDNSSPTIKHCIIKNCTVTGAQGGHGSDGINGPWTWANPDPNLENLETEDGQWGGHGGHGWGHGYGGAIACRGGSSPTIENCVFEDNIARGGRGGDGGNGGQAAGTPPDDWDGFESGGGNGGMGDGCGMGGTIYAETNCQPVIRDCKFIINTATEGLGGMPGQRGPGNPITSLPDTHDPLDALLGLSLHTYGTLSINGGAAYCNSNPPLEFSRCEFTGNQAYYDSNPYPSGNFVYRDGGALYLSYPEGVELYSCNFTDNTAGAVYITPHSGAIITIYDNTADANTSGSFSSNIRASSGGALYIGSGASSVEIQGYNFSGNWAYNSGGALFCKSKITVKDCSFSVNTADYDDNGSGTGGAIDVDFSSTNDAEIHNSAFFGNEAVYGGAVHIDNADVNLGHCDFYGNEAESGGGLSLIDCIAEVNSGSFKNNKATYIYGFGGGLDCVYTDLKIWDCVISGNTAEGAYSFGGGISLDAGPIAHTVRNCLLYDNSAYDGGAISCTYGESNEVEIRSSTFVNNFANNRGGAVFIDWDSYATITDSIISNCSGGAIYEEVGGGDATATYNLFYQNTGGDYYDSGTGEFYYGNEVLLIPGGSNNNYGDPLFTDPFNDDFYLSQPPDQTGPDYSPALNVGSVDLSPGFDPNVLGWDPREYSTSTNEDGDTGWLDLGFHYKESIEVYIPKYTLTTGVDPEEGGTLTFEPVKEEYPLGEVVTLTAEPASGWLIKAWHGTDNDASKETTNFVTMNYDRNVTVEFRQPRTFTVGTDPNYPTIESAIFDAEDGDIVLVSPGLWHINWLYINKPITIRSVDPNYPENTVLDSGDHGRAIEFSSAAGKGTILDGFTIQGDPNHWVHGGTGEDADEPGENGEDGGCIDGLGVYINRYASPTIKNCIIKHHNIEGGNGTNGFAADTTHNAGRGGWGGWARGAGIYCGAFSSPAFINCQILENVARGGHGGDGGDYDDEGGFANYGGNWSTAPGWNYDIMGIGGIWVNGHLWEVWQHHEEWPWWDDVILNWWNWDYFGDYRWYTGYGAGVFCQYGSNVTFTKCTISDNLTYGGNSGQGGYYSEGPIDRLDPKHRYQLPSYGAGVYCAEDSNVVFIDCAITDNLAGEPNESYHLDPYLGHGGGICAEDCAQIVLQNCLVSDNISTVGGGILLDNANPKIINCIIKDNKAYQGGGILGDGGTGTIIDCTITDNQAWGWVTDPNYDTDPEDYDPNHDYYLPGDGGGLHCDSTDYSIIDCNITENVAGGTGGGVFFTGTSAPTMFNCLIHRNEADRGGGGVTSQTFVQPTITNCTIADNSASGSHFDIHQGGGLLARDNTTVDITNTIIWGNSAETGAQIAITEAPATVEANYSDVQGGAVGVFVDTGCTLIWVLDPNDPNRSTNLDGTSEERPRFEYGDLGSLGGDGGFFLKQIAAGQDEDSPCVDAGSTSAIDIGLYKHTTRTDGIIDGYDYAQPDSNVADIGYHYVLKTHLEGDFNFDGVVDDYDYQRLFDPNLYWLESGCEFPDWCYGLDLNKDGRVNFRDYAVFANNYNVVEDTPPRPDPMTWSVPPYSSGADSISMKATKAIDNSTINIKYEFKCVYGNCNDKAWDTEPNYTDDTGLVTGNKYGYKVRAQDENNNMTDWSFIGYAIAGETAEEAPAAPSSLVATAISSTQIDLAWSDNSDNESGFRMERRIGDDAYESLTTTSENVTSYSDTGLTAETTYTYRLRAYNSTGDSGYSNEASATTPAEGGGADIDPPITPFVDSRQDPYDPYQAWWLVWPYVIQGSGFHYMQAQTATDETGPVWYYFECVIGSGLDSGWQLEDIYTYYWNSNCYYRVNTRDSANPANEGNWSPMGYTANPGVPY